MQSNQREKMFMVHCSAGATPTVTGSRLAVGPDALREAVGEFITAFSPESRNLMRMLIEQDQAHLLEMFQGKPYRTVHNSRQTQHVDIYLITGARGL